MRNKNLFALTMAVAMFAACEKENEVIPVQDTDTYVEIQLPSIQRLLPSINYLTLNCMYYDNDPYGLVENSLAVQIDPKMLSSNFKVYCLEESGGTPTYSLKLEKGWYCLSITYRTEANHDYHDNITTCDGPHENNLVYIDDGENVVFSY